MGGGGGGGGGRAGWVAFGGGSKKLVEGVYWGKDFSRWKEMIRFLKRIVQKSTQVNRWIADR